MNTLEKFAELHHNSDTKIELAQEAMVHCGAELEDLYEHSDGRLIIWDRGITTLEIKDLWNVKTDIPQQAWRDHRIKVSQTWKKHKMLAGTLISPIADPNLVFAKIEKSGVETYTQKEILRELLSRYLADKDIKKDNDIERITKLVLAYDRSVSSMNMNELKAVIDYAYKTKKESLHLPTIAWLFITDKYGFSGTGITKDSLIKLTEQLPDNINLEAFDNFKIEDKNLGGFINVKHNSVLNSVLEKVEELIVSDNLKEDESYRLSNGYLMRVVLFDR